MNNYIYEICSAAFPFFIVVAYLFVFMLWLKEKVIDKRHVRPFTKEQRAAFEEMIASFDEDFSIASNVRNARDFGNAFRAIKDKNGNDAIDCIWGVNPQITINPHPQLNRMLNSRMVGENTKDSINRIGGI